METIRCVLGSIEGEISLRSEGKMSGFTESTRTLQAFTTSRFDWLRWSSWCEVAASRAIMSRSFSSCAGNLSDAQTLVG